MIENHDHEAALATWLAAQKVDPPAGVPPCATCAERWAELNAIEASLDAWGERKRTLDLGEEGDSGTESARRVLGPLLAQQRDELVRPVGKKTVLPWVLLAASAILLLWLNRPGRENSLDSILDGLPDGVMLAPGGSGWTLIEPIGRESAFEVFRWDSSGFPGASYELVIYDGARYAKEGVNTSPLIRIERIDTEWIPDVELPEVVHWLVISKNAEGREVERSSGWASRSSH